MTQSELIVFDDRASGSPDVLRIWRSESLRAGEFLSVAYAQWEIVVARVEQARRVFLRGPETGATRSPVPAGGVWLGIRFRAAAYLRGVNHASLRDRSIELPVADSGHFWLNGAKWEVPTFENADDFAERLSRSGSLIRDLIVSTVLEEGMATGVGERTRQRRFAFSTGLSYRAASSIERAQSAALMLREGLSINDTVALAGFSDQPHLTRSLKALIGITPGQLRMRENMTQLSFIPKPEDRGVRSR